MTGIAETLEAARAKLERLDPAQTQAAVEQGAILVDIRPVAQRETFGEFPGAVVIERNVLEWRLDPTSTAALPWASHDAHVVIACQEGYQSSLAAAALVDLGITRATDLAGGFEAWKADGLPTA